MDCDRDTCDCPKGDCHAGLTRERDALRAELALLRPVVEAAEKWLEYEDHGYGFHGCDPPCCTACRLASAVAAYQEKKGMSDAKT